MRGATNDVAEAKAIREISIHAPHAGRDARNTRTAHNKTNFNPRAPCGARLASSAAAAKRRHFNPRAPCGARRVSNVCIRTTFEISIHAPHAGRDLHTYNFRSMYIISIHAPHAGRDEYQHQHQCQTAISIHAPHAGRDSKSIQNYFTHFCDKKQFLDNFTQNAAFQSVLPLADRQKLLYLRCEPLRKFLRAFASHYKIIGSSGR